MSRKKSGVYSNNSYNVTRINGRKRYKSNTKSLTYLDGNGNKSTIIQTSNVDIDKRNSFIINLFKISLVLIFGGYFFSNGVNGFNNSQLLNTTTTELISNNINGTNYEYRVHSSNYDYISKLNQLYTLRNVFDLEPISTDISMLVEPKESLFLSGGQFHNYYDIYYDLVVKDSDIGEEVMYIDTATIDINGTDYTYTLFRLNELQDEEHTSQFYNKYSYFLDNFVNWKNAPQYQDYLRGIDTDNWYDDIIYAFKVLNAPIIWLGNFAYDLGVIISFLVNW